MEVSSSLSGRHKVVARPPGCPKEERLEKLSAIVCTDVAHEASGHDGRVQQCVCSNVLHVCSEGCERLDTDVWGPWVNSHPDHAVSV